MDGLTRILTKCAGGADPQAQALQTAAQMAKGPAGVALPTLPEKPEEQVADDKALIAANKEVDSKKKEIDTLRHQLQEAKLDVLKIQMKSDLADQQTKMRESLQKEQTQMFEKLRQEQKELDKRQLEFKMEEAKHKADMAAAESAHQAKLDKSVAAHDVQIAENKAKSLIDLANQSTKQYSSMMEQARKHSDAYFADKSKQYDASHPAIGPALQSRIDASLNAISRLGNPYSKVASFVDPSSEARSNFLWNNKNVNYVDPGNDDMSATLRPLRDYLLSGLPDDPTTIDQWAQRRAYIEKMRRDLGSAGVNKYGDLIDNLRQDVQQGGDYRAASALRTLIDIANPDDGDTAGAAANAKHYGNIQDELEAWERELNLKINQYSNKNNETIQKGGPDAERARYAQATFDRRNQLPVDAGAAVGNTIQKLFRNRGTYNAEYPSYYDRMAGNDMGKLDEDGNFVSSNPSPKWDLMGYNNAINSVVYAADVANRRNQLGLGHIEYVNGQSIDNRTGKPASTTDTALVRDLVNESGELPSVKMHYTEAGQHALNSALLTATGISSVPSKLGNLAEKAISPIARRAPQWLAKTMRSGARLGGGIAEDLAVMNGMDSFLNHGRAEALNSPLWNTQQPQQNTQQPAQNTQSQQQNTMRPLTHQPYNNTQRLAANTPLRRSRGGYPSNLNNIPRSTIPRGADSLYRDTSRVKQAAAGAHEFNNATGLRSAGAIRTSANTIKSRLMDVPALGLLAGFIPQNLLSPNVPLLPNKYQAWDSNRIAENYGRTFRRFSDYSSPLAAQFAQQYARNHGLLI